MADPLAAGQIDDRVADDAVHVRGDVGHACLELRLQVGGRSLRPGAS
jgi:hypothetical protein